jgi:hypothetical protein
MTLPISNTRLGPETIRNGALLGAGAWDASPQEIDTTNVHTLRIYINYAQGVGGGGTGFARLKWQYTPDPGDSPTWYDATLDDTGTIVASADGFETQVDTAVKNFPVETGKWTYAIDTTACASVRVFFAEGGTPGVAGTLVAQIVGQAEEQ